MDLALVGVMVAGVENLSLASLASAARERGYETALVPFDGFAALDRTIARVLALRPRVCGVSIQSTESLLAVLTFTRLLRARGFAGRIVAGGHVATLHAADIVEADAGVDVVVRLAGEDAIVALLRDPDAVEVLAVPGAVVRDAEGRARLGAPARPLGMIPRPPPTERAIGDHLGVAAADLVASRGCEATCAYCCVAGASALAAAEASRAGDARADARYVRRAIGPLADEMAGLFHERGVRAFHFMDDNLLPLEPGEATRWVRALRAALDERGVPAIACAMQLRADAVTDESADALLALGLGRAYVGIDGYSAGQLRMLGRASQAEDGPRALATLRSRGIAAVSNALVLGPTTQLETLAREAEALRRVRGGPVHLLPIEARRGSVIARRAERAGLLEGGPLHVHYRFADPRVARVGRMLFALPTRLRQRSVPVAMYDLAYNLGIAARLHDGVELGPTWALWDETSAVWNEDQADVLLRAVEAAHAGEAAVEVLTAIERRRTGALDGMLLGQIDRALHDLERSVSKTTRAPARAHARSLVMGMLASAMSLAGCAGETAPPSDAGVDAAHVDDGGVDAAARPAVDTGVDAAGADGAACAVDPGPSQTTPGSQSCTTVEVRAHVDAAGHVTGFEGVAADGSTVVLPADVRACLDALFAQYCYPSAAGGDVLFDPHAWIA